jgi:hypothetical protein
VPKRPRFSRWRRLPPVFRTGEHRPVGTGDELDRLILYLPTRLLDLAEVLAEKAGIPAVQDYCAKLLARALEAERIQQKVADFEARRGPLQGLKEIAADPDYLAEWQARAEQKPDPAAGTGAVPGLQGPSTTGSGTLETVTVDLVLGDGDDTTMEPPIEENTWQIDEPAPADEQSVPSDQPASRPVVSMTPRPVVQLESSGAVLEVVWRHAGMVEDDWGFLPCLRRGSPVPENKVSELLRALAELERRHHGAQYLERRLAHALHRLALESQVLLTDAWPGVFDDKVIATIRSVQEAVERILSGQDIRYYPTAAPPDSEQAR